MALKQSTRPKSSLRSNHVPKRVTRIAPQVNSDETASETLLRVATHLFALNGLSGTSIRDIAHEARMNSAQISYYYKNKEGLYRACLADIAKSRIAAAEDILIPAKNQEEFRVRLRMFIENLYKYFLENRDTGLIVIRESDRTQSPAQDIFQSYFSQLYSLLIDFFQAGYKKGFTTHGADALVTTSVFFGAVMSELRLDHIKENLFKRTIKNSGERAKSIGQLVKLFSK